MHRGVQPESKGWWGEEDPQTVIETFDQPLECITDTGSQAAPEPIDRSLGEFERTAIGSNHQPDELSYPFVGVGFEFTFPSRPKTLRNEWRPTRNNVLGPLP